MIDGSFIKIQNMEKYRFLQRVAQDSTDILETQVFRENLRRNRQIKQNLDRFSATFSQRAFNILYSKKGLKHNNFV